MHTVDIQGSARETPSLQNRDFLLTVLCGFQSVLGTVSYESIRRALLHRGFMPESRHVDCALGQQVTGTVSADIFLGKIKTWNDKAPTDLNPGLKIDGPITVVRRWDGSGTTLLFVDYLSKVAPDWKTKVGDGTDALICRRATVTQHESAFACKSRCTWLRSHFMHKSTNAHLLTQPQ